MTTKDAKNLTRVEVAPQIASGLDRMWDSGFCAGLLILSQQIRDNEKTTAQTTRIQERIQELLGSM
jgi:hypothetical protein